MKQLAPLHAVLVFTDRSPQEHHVLRRAASLAADHGAMLEHRVVPRDAPLHVFARDTAGADLLVLPERRQPLVAALLQGQPVTRVLRDAEVPVLVVRRDVARPWHRVLAGVDFSAESDAVAAYAGQLAEDAELELFHAVCTRDETRLRSAEATEQAVLAFRANGLQRAQERMRGLVPLLGRRPGRIHTAIGRGDPGRQLVVQEAQTRADLVVVGKEASTAWGDFFGAAVAHRVLGWGTSDLLVVPYAYVRGVEAGEDRAPPRAVKGPRLRSMAAATSP